MERCFMKWSKSVQRKTAEDAKHPASLRMTHGALSQALATCVARTVRKHKGPGEQSEPK